MSGRWWWKESGRENWRCKAETKEHPHYGKDRCQNKAVEENGYCKRHTSKEKSP